MDKRIIGIIIPVIAIIAVSSVLFITPSSEITTYKNNENIGLVINSPSSSISLQQLDEIFTDASSTGIGRSNVYLFWNIIEPVEGKFDWSQSDIIMGLNEKNNHKVTLYFSIINGATLGPFPDWIGKPTLNGINEDELVNTLDIILSRYDIVDSLIIAGETESQFRYNERFIPVYAELFSNVYDRIKDKHPDVQIGNSFALHQVINKNLEHIVTDLAIGDAIEYYKRIGAERKEARLRYLQNYWTKKVRNVGKIIVNTPKESHRSCAIANVGIKNMKPHELAKTLMEKYNIWTVAIDGANVHGCRITPNIYTTPKELDVFVEALRELGK